MRRSLRYMLLISFAGLIAYSNTFHVPFQFDDFNNITGNPLIRNLAGFLSGGRGFAYNPRRFIGFLTFALNYHFGGLNVVGYHLANLIVHITTAIAVYFLVLLTFRTPYFEAVRREESEERGRETEEGGNPGGPEAASHAIRHSPFTLHDSRFFDASHLIALFSALLFVAHPLQTEAVTYIVQRFASLAAMFYLLSVVMYIKGRLITERVRSHGRSVIGERQEDKKTGLWPVHTETMESSVPITHYLSPITFFLLSLFFAVLSMMTKETSFTLPIVIVLYEFIFFKSSLKKKVLFLAPLLLTLLIIPVSILGTHKPLGEIISDLSEKTRVQTNIPRWDYLMTQMRVIITYLRLLFFPVNQNLDYDYPVSHSLLSPPVLVSFLFLAAIFGAGGYLLYKARGHRSGVIRESVMGQGSEVIGEEGEWPMAHDPSPITPFYLLIAFGIFWFFITLSVESSFIPIVDVIFEHRVYLPSAGVFIAVTSAVFVLLARTFRNRRTAVRAFAAFFSVVVICLCAGTLARNAVWGSDLSLWEDVVKKSPGNARAYNNLGYIYLGEGQTDKALAYFRTAIRLKPEYADARDNAGVALYEKGLFDAAIGRFREAVSLMPGISDFHHDLGLAYVQKGLLDDGIAEFEEAVRLRPDDYEIYNDLGVAYRRKGYTGKAIGSFSKAIELNPGYAGAHYNLGLLYESMGMSDKAREELARAHHLEPGKF